MSGMIRCYLVKEDGLDDGCDKHEDGDGVTKEGGFGDEL